MAFERRRSVCGKIVMFALMALLPAMSGAQATASEAHAKGDIAGDWQGTIQFQKPLRNIVRIAKADKGWSAKMYSIDQGGQAINVSSLTLDGSAVKLTVEMLGVTYVGALSADGETITGTFTQGTNAVPLTLVRTTKETAWEIPAPPPPPKMMPADADPAFDVATIKPSDPGVTMMQALFFNGHSFMTKASSLLDLMSFAYEVQAKQIVGLPDWAGQERYDLLAVPNTDGMPNSVQFRSMVRKLLVDRFQLTFHKDKRELSAYVLTVAKSGSKLKPTDAGGPGPGFGFRPTAGGLAIPIRNANMDDFAGFLQSTVLDRPVVDATQIKGRFDFLLTFTPDDSEFNGHPPKLPEKTEATEAAPSLFEAMQQELGLKLEAQKTAVSVIAIDRAEKPSAN